MMDKILFEAMRRQRRSTWIAIAFAVVASIAGVALLAVSGWFLTGAALAGAGGLAVVKAFNYLLPSALIRTLAIARTLSRYGERLFSHRAALFALADVRPALFAKLAFSEPKAILLRSPGEIAAQLGDDVDAMEDAAIRKVTTPSAFAAFATALFAAALSGWAAALAVACGFAIMVMVAQGMTRHLVPHGVERRAEAMAALKSAFADYAPCAADILAYDLTPMVDAALSPHTRALDAARLSEVKAEALIMGVQTTLAACLVAAVLALANNGVAFAALSALAVAGAAEIWAGLARNAVQAVRVRYAASRLESIVALAPRLPSEQAANGSVIGIQTATQSSSLVPGQRVLIAGPTGVGKTRLLGTLMGLRSDAPQKLSVNGTDVGDLGLDQLRSHFAYAPQDAALIAGTVVDNLRLSRPGVDEPAMWEALQIACLDKVVSALPDGLNTWLGNDGARLSGGQRKRLALARALLAGRPWLILDEPSEGLDAATEAQLAARLRQWLDKTGAGLILVSHRRGLHPLVDMAIALD